MKVRLKLARIGMNMEEATIVKWHREAGSSFAVGDPIYDIETEKVTEEVTATSPGTLIEVLVAEGETVAVGTELCVVDIIQG